MDAEQERNWAIACHLSSLAWIVLAFVGIGAIPFVNVIAPAVVWYLKKEESELIDAHGKESVNFQISMTIYGLAAGIILSILIIAGVVLMILLGIGGSNNPFAALVAIVTGIGFFIFLALIVAIAIFQIAVVILAATKVQEGQMYRYPFNLRLLK
ncbi:MULTISPECIES: DUF4870 domain-containing protein [Cyanophyceae]|uniref:DUF4870 domain-containing protein n=1 Tax=Cyanophyceae TaxID=3028117 RepID=UPI00016DC91D|nr:MULTISPECIES: DUF4870 domain-containing protein [Cyanophyceae]ACB00437.1 conserved hypothetical membrane protein [Picosynechococcus sp. PCC 7002]AMA10023.1 hypothetical protein AWQ23_12255 [Picosynechococcus sp. PCC 73109]ANV88192.1 hypothetical protein AWQ22_12385 [Picosynechococcus sp. PCC 7117]ANV91392.1 hypothetical protein AWQ24_12545 [Picosynechococcus sp. PCC 8807]QCS48284.1 DUF4870 domain-containing protein [Picosynechococcus sp. PCC 11901]